MSNMYPDADLIQRLSFNPSTLETIDRAMFEYVEELNLFTTTNKGWTKVPVIWSTSERAFHSKKGSSIRDQQGALILPLISINRSAVQKPLASRGAFVGNVPQNNDAQGGSIPLERVIYQEKTANFAAADAKRLNSQFNYPRENGKIVYRTVSIPMPVNVEVAYEITMRTEYQQQMNDLVSPFMTTPGTINHAIIKSNEHRYEAFIDQGFTQTNNLNDYSAEERKFETKITIKVIGYLVGEGDNTKKAKFAVRENAVEVKIPRERISLAEIPEHEYGSYYGLSGISLPEAKKKSPFSLFFSNVPAAGAGATATEVPAAAAPPAAGQAEGTIVTANNFAQYLFQNMIIREEIKQAEEDPLWVPRKVFSVQSATVLTNSETVFVNGVIQALGADNDYTIIGNTISFTYDIKDEDSIYITYIKG